MSGIVKEREPSLRKTRLRRKKLYQIVKLNKMILFNRMRREMNMSKNKYLMRKAGKEVWNQVSLDMTW